MTWNYFATSHGKGEVDGVSALFKKEVQKEQMKPDGMKLQNTAKFLTFLNVESNEFICRPNICKVRNPEPLPRD